jgi:N-acetylneuraminic acid mutarotase
MGAMTGRFPNETPLEKVVVYYPEEDRFDFVHSIPESRRRGGAGAVLHDGMIYLVGGITNGHIDGYQPWLDRYDPKTGQWTILDDAPHARDHFPAVVHDDKLYCFGGRRTSKATGKVFDLTVAPVDVYDLKSHQWLPPSQSPVLPTPRAGNMVTVWNDEVIVGGGETTQKTAHDTVEAYNVVTRQWRKWPSLNRGRHGSGFAIVGNHVYTASGSGNRGGSPELTSIERIALPGR